MERQQLQPFIQSANEKRGGKSSCRVQSEKFVVPTHPAYIIAADFEASHIMSLQAELEKHYIAMGLQTGRKKLMKIPQMPSDRFFIIADDSRGPPLLEGEFLIIQSHVVHYPVANSVEQVVAAFDSYIGLGHFERTEEYYQNNDNINGSAQKVGQNNHQIRTANSSISQTKSICLKEVSSLRERTNFNQGKLFVYRNRNDNQEYRAIVSQLQTSFQNCSSIIFVERIDEYNGFTRSSQSHDYFVLMSHYSLIKLSQYFLKLKGIAVFADQHQKVDLFSIRNIVLLTSRKEMVFRFVEQFVNQHATRPLTATEHAKKSNSQAAAEIIVKSKEQKQTVGLSQDKKSEIKLVRVSDLNKTKEKKLGCIEKTDHVKPQQRSNKLTQNSQNIAIPKAVQPILSHLIVTQNNQDKSTIQPHKISKIKRLKSSKSSIQINQQGDKGQQVKQQPNLNIQNAQKNTIRPNTSLVNSHLRMGSDNYNKRSQQKAQPNHRRMKSDDNEDLSPKICMISPIPSNIEEPTDAFISKQRKQLFIPKKPQINLKKSKENRQHFSTSNNCPILAQKQSPQSREKVAQDRHFLPNKIKNVEKKVIKSNTVPPAQQVISSISALNQQDQGVNFDIEGAGLSNISSIPLKQTSDAADRNKRFTFGLREQVKQKIDKDRQVIKNRKEPRKSKSLSQVHRVFNRIKPLPLYEAANEIINQNGLGDPYQQSLLPNRTIRTVNSPRAGKIYSQIRPRNLKKRLSKLESEITPENEFLQDEIIKRSLSVQPNTTEGRFPFSNNRNIQDLIDMSRFQKVIENGMVVYRSKFPVQASEYFPTVVHDKLISTKNPRTNQSIIEKSLENPYDIVSKKESQKQKAIKRVKYEGDFMQQNVGVQCQPQYLTNKQSKHVFQPRYITNNISSSTNSKQASRKYTGPICQMLTSKVSNSLEPQPQLIKDIQSPDLTSNNNSSMNQDNGPSQVTDNVNLIVLYLVEKTQPYWMFQKLKQIKSSKDSLISFKDQKQLAQQLPQTINIYDIVYVIPREATANIEKMIKNQPNCYVVHITEGNVKVGTKRVQVRELKQLKDLSEQLQLQQPTTKRMENKTKILLRPKQIKKSPLSHQCCSHCPRHS